MTRKTHLRRVGRRGLTLTELLIAGTIMTLLAAGMGTLVMTVHATNDFCRGQATAAQHARVALDRVQRAVRTAAASEPFPGCLVVSQSAGGFDFPDTLVVWSPTAAAVDPSGLPRVNELVIFCCDPATPSRLIELRAPSNTSTCPASDNASAWATLVDGLKVHAASTKVQLSDRIRTADVAGNTRGCLRFELLMAPSAANWAAYRGGTLTWKNLDWPLDFYSTQTGMRRVACQTEMQILPGDSNSAQTAAPFFGSATSTYELTR